MRDGIPSQLARIDFTGGLDTRSDDRLVLPTKLVQLVNATLAPTLALTRRDGWTPLVNQSATSLAVLGKQLLAVNGAALFTYSPGEGAVNQVGQVSQWRVSKQEVLRSGNYQKQHDTAASNTLSCHVWTEVSAQNVALGVFYTIVDDQTGAIIVAPTSFGPSTSGFPRVVCVDVVNNVFVVLRGDTSAQAVIAAVVTPAVHSGSLTVANDYFCNGGTTLYPFDACFYSATGEAFVLYPSTNAGDSIRAVGVSSVSNSPSVTHGPFNIVPVGTMTAAHTCALACAQGPAAGLGMVMVDTSTGNVYSATYTSTYSTLTGPSLLGSSILTSSGVAYGRAALAFDGTNYHAFIDGSSATGTTNLSAVAPLKHGVFSTTNVFGSYSTLINSTIANEPAVATASPMGPFIAAKPIVAQGNVFLPVFIFDPQTPPPATVGVQAQYTGLQNGLYVLDMSANVVAKAMYGSYGPFSYNLPFTGYAAGNLQNGSICSVSTPVANLESFQPIFTFLAGERSLLSLQNGVNITQTGIARLSFVQVAAALTPNSPTSLVRAQLGESLYFAGANLTQFDGQQVAEAEFLMFPEGVFAAVGAADASNNIPAGNYFYAACYETVDGSGRRHQGDLSPTFEYAAPGSKKTNVNIPTILLGARAANAQIVVFRSTLANPTTLYRLGDTTNNTLPILNATNAAFVTYVDDQSDSAISGNEIAYTESGTLGNDSPPPSTVCAAHQNRLFIDVADDTNAYQFSQTLIDRIGLQWNAALRGRVDPSGRGITAFASLDDKCIIFCKTKIFYLFGAGPDSTGNGVFQGPYEIPSDVGCIEPRSVLKIPIGIMFKSAKGWYLLSRSLQVMYIGGGVAAYDANTVSSAVLMEDRKEARFPGPVNTLVYCYDALDPQSGIGQWCTFTNPGTLDAVYWPGFQGRSGSQSTSSAAYVHADSRNNQINVDTPGVYSDGGLPIPVTIELGWIGVNTLLGFQRIRRLVFSGSYGGPSTIALSLFYNGDNTPVGPVSVSSSNLQTPGGNSWLWRVKPNPQRCSTIRIQLVDTPTSATAGVNFSTMTAEVAILPGAARLGAAQTN